MKIHLRQRTVGFAIATVACRLVAPVVSTAAPAGVDPMMTVDYPALVARADLDLEGAPGPADTPNPRLRLGTLQ
jgi:hypothetical protein